MGIPHYFRVIAQTYPEIIGLSMPPTDHIFFDFNGAIHQSAKKIIDQKKKQNVNIIDLYDDPSIRDLTEGTDGSEEDIAPIEKEIMDAVEEYVRSLTNIIQPKMGIYIYMDGVAPHAKLMQQRKRRYLSMMRYKLLNTEPIWDTNAISPGTIFMIRLGAFLRRQLRYRPLKNGITTKFSFSDENGEAEHKIFASMACIPHDEKVMIHGLDADLIMLSLLSHRPNITLMREYQDSTEFQFLYIDNLRKGILKELSEKYRWPIDPEGGVFEKQACDAIESYVVACFLLGNDFLPHMPTLHLQKFGLQKILAACQYTMLVNSTNSQIDWDIMCYVLEQLLIEENDIMYRLVSDSITKRCHAKTDEEKVDMYPLLEENKSDLTMEIHYGYGARMKNNPAWIPIYYKKLFHTRVHDLGVVSNACREYMTGMEWTYRYYKRLSRDSTWYYPYLYAPAMSDLANHIATSKEDHMNTVQIWKEKYKVPTFIPDYVQLLCILPPESVHLIPGKLRGIMTDPNLGCTHMYPRKYPILTFLKTRLWECSPVLPALDIDLLQKNARRVVTQIDRINPRKKATEAFSHGFHIAK
jgi:5'-3' exonuclease